MVYGVHHMPPRWKFDTVDKKFSFPPFARRKEALELPLLPCRSRFPLSRLSLSLWSLAGTSMEYSVGS